jgi:uncharacterized protein DUF6527
MKTNAQFSLKGVVQSRQEIAGLLRAPGDAVLVERGVLRWLILACPCGCGSQLPINLDPRTGPAWRLYQDSRRGMSLYPSVWRETDCGSHFILWRDKIIVLGANEESIASQTRAEVQAELRLAVLARIPKVKSVSYLDLAKHLNEVPWEILAVCRDLVLAGTLREGKSKRRGRFARVRA